ncbi:MAG: hypothetical protein A2Z83_05155 [Omnitrophica bacterium GWA2_52_8]|nr:MAG: hypothetical protein A2Z83_05155 [Omnitrophica bacterium GWA2_52_8]
MATKSVETRIKEKKIAEVINPKLVRAESTITLRQALDIMQKNKSGYIVVADANKVVGIFTEVDVTRKILANRVKLDLRISEFMTKNPSVLSPQDTVGHAMELMGDKRFYHIPLVNQENDLCGVLSVRTLIRFMAEFYPTEVFNLPPNSDQVMESQEGG